MDQSSSLSCPACGAWWRLPLLLALVLAAVVLLRGNGVRDEVPDSGGVVPERAAAASETVSLAIDFGDSTIREFEAIAWHKGMTVANALAAAGDGADGIVFAHRGSGEMAFLTELGGVANEGAAGRNWIYSVNGERADRSFAVYRLEPGDRVLWSFAPPQ